VLQQFSIRGFEIGGKRTFIIAEAGVNHNGDIDLAKELIIEAKKANVDAIKFQIFIAEELVTVYAPKAEYQKNLTSKTESQFDMIKNLELSFEEFKELQKYALHQRILFLATPFDLQSVNFLAEQNIPAFKVSSGDMNNLIILDRIIEEEKPLLLSTGMASIDEISETYQFLIRKGVKKLLLFHCVTDYPASFNSLNLRMISTLKQKFKVPIGYSDHSTGITAPRLAVAAGANAIEKHFTLNKEFHGPDHKASLEPEELIEMVASIRLTEEILGSPDKKLTEAEIKNRVVARKSIVAARDLQKGKSITIDDISVKRPGDGIPPTDIDRVLGKTLKTDIKKNKKFTWEDLSD
jgi:N-acetylneuraminate synthase